MELKVMWVFNALHVNQSLKVCLMHAGTSDICVCLFEEHSCSHRDRVCNTHCESCRSAMHISPPLNSLHETTSFLADPKHFQLMFRG